MNRPARCALAAIVLGGCVHVDRTAPTHGPPGAGVTTPPPPRKALPVAHGAPGPEVEAVLAAARAHVGRRSVRVNGQSFRYDCSGFVRGVFSTLGVDLMSLGGEYPGLNGVGLIFRFNERYGENHFRKVPAPGDVVYFDDSWDMNGNGRLDDPLTHLGVVESVDADGTFHVIHRTHRGIVRDPMNLLRPRDRADESGKPLNAWLRSKSRRDPPGAGHLMGELFAGFGTVRVPAPMASATRWDDLPSAAEGEPAPD